MRMCAPGSGGAACAKCDYGSYSAGGTAADPLKECTPCAPGKFTARVGARAAGECASPGVRSCEPGYASVDGACDPCPVGRYSAGGTVGECTACPGTTTTRAPGATSAAACFDSRGATVVTGAAYWTALPGGVFSQACRQDLAALFSNAARWDGWRADRIKSLPDGCVATDGGLTEMRLLWALRTLRASTAGLFQPAVPGSLPVNWAAVGAAEYAALFGSCPRAKVPALTPVADLEALFLKVGDACTPGRVLVGVLQQEPADRHPLLGLVTTALAEREGAAYQAAGGGMDADMAYAWLLLRRLQDDVEQSIPGLRPETPPSGNLSLVALDGSLGAGLSGRRLLAPAAPQGLMLASMTDSAGRPLNLVCGAGLYPNGTMAGRMAIDGWAYGAARWMMTTRRAWFRGLVVFCAYRHY